MIKCWIYIFIIFSLNVSFADVIPLARHNSFLVKNLTESDSQELSQKILDYVISNNIEIVYLGENHYSAEVQKVQEYIVELLSKKSQFDCISLERASIDTAMSLFFPLNQPYISESEWIKIYQAYWKYNCQLLDIRFQYNGACYNEATFTRNAQYLWRLAKKSQLKFFGHEMELQDFHNAIYDLKINNPEKDKMPRIATSKYWNTHWILRNDEHAKNIVENFKSGQCQKMIVIEGDGHLESDHVLRESILINKNQRQDFERWPLVKPIDEQVFEALGKQSIFIRLNSRKLYEELTQERADLSIFFE